jgi:hypothetical protein
MWIPVTVPLVVPAEELYDLAFRCQGRWLDFMARAPPPNHWQVLNVTDFRVPIPLPDRPLPLLREAFIFESQVVGSGALFRAFDLFVAPTLVDDAVTAPPGLTVQVVAARAGAAVMPRASAAAAAGAAP